MKLQHDDMGDDLHAQGQPTSRVLLRSSKGKSVFIHFEWLEYYALKRNNACVTNMSVID